eukprot:scaffold2141_cov350-Prasinococcus_capsulatus_cf.AAC.2
MLALVCRAGRAPAPWASGRERSAARGGKARVGRYVTGLHTRARPALAQGRAQLSRGGCTTRSAPGGVAEADVLAGSGRGKAKRRKEWAAAGRKGLDAPE